MKRLLAIAASSLLILTGCASEPEFGEVSSAIQDSQEMQAEESQGELEDQREDEVRDSESGESQSEGSDSAESQAEDSESGMSQGVDTEEQESNSQNFAIQLSDLRDDASTCKYKEASPSRQRYANSYAASFPKMQSPAISQIGHVDVALVFLDWGDLPGTSADVTYYLEQVNMFVDFYEMVSEGSLTFTVQTDTTWYRVGESYEPYITSNDESGGNWQSTATLQPKLDDFITATDEAVDYSGIEMLIFAIPTAKEVWWGGLHDFGGEGATKAITNEGEVKHWVSVGSWFIENPGQPSWVFYAHEFGHAVGLVDYRDMTDSSVTKEGLTKIIGEKWVVNPMGGLEIMDNQGGPTRTISFWPRWVQGWAVDEQAICISANDVQDESFKLSQLNRVGAADKALIIKIDDTTALVVESRRWDRKFDVPIRHSRDGLIVYRVDSTLGHEEGPLRLLSPRDITQYLKEEKTYPDWRCLDVFLYEGDKVTAYGVTIESVGVFDGSDVVRVTRSNP